MATHVLIIGAGAIGLSSALALSQTGRRVTLIDRGATGGESTWAGAGILSSLPPWGYSAEVNDLIRRGSRLWPEWAERLKQQSGIDPEYRRSGMLALDIADSILAEQWCREQDYPIADAPAELAHLIRRPGQALWLPEIGQVRNPRLAQALSQSLRSMGIDILTDRAVLGLVREASAIAGVNTAQGLVQADQYVLAAGAWSQGLLDKQADGLDIHPVRGQMLLFKTPPGLLPCIVYRDGHYLVPRADGHILAGSTLEYVGFDKDTTESAHAELLAFAQEVLPALDESKIVRQWAGLRPGSPKGIPTIARHPVYDNLYINSGHFRYGVTMAPASAEILTRLITGAGESLDPKPYAWPRPQAQS